MVNVLDPIQQALYAGHLVYLSEELYRYVYDEAWPAPDRAYALLAHVGHGNLPRSNGLSGRWRADPGIAFGDALQEELRLEAGFMRAATHVVYHALPLEPNDRTPQYTSTADYVEYTDVADISVSMAGMFWRSGARHDLVHHASFGAPVEAAIAPKNPHAATAHYRDRYDELGKMRTVEPPSPPQPPSPGPR